MMQRETLEKKHSEISITNVTFGFVLAISILPFLFKLIGIQEHFSSRLSLVVTLLLVSLCTVINIRKIATKGRVLCLTVNIASLIVTVLTVGAMGVSMIHINTLLILWLFNSISFYKKQYATIHLLLAVLICQWLMTLDYTYIKNAYVTEPDDMYVNPCTVAIMTLVCYYHFILFMECIETRNGWLKYTVVVISTIFALRLILESVCRASLLALIVFGVLVFFRSFVIKNYRQILVCAMIFVLLFPLAYILLAQVSDGWEFFGKNFFTGRQGVWQSVLEAIANAPIFGTGAGNDIPLHGGYMGDAHNFFIGIWKYIGIVPMITMFCVIPKGRNIKCITKNNQLGKLMFLSCFIICAVETLLNSAEYYIFYLTLLITVKNERLIREK